MKINNFDFLRLVFAIFVIITHSYSLTGLPENDFLSRITNQQITFAFIGLSGFFTISGYLIYQSLIRSKTLGDYFIKRSLRIFPGLIVALFFTVLLGTFITNLPLRQYFTSHSVSTYILKNSILFSGIQFSLVDVFKGNPHKAVNGSIWTIPYEFFFYIFLAGLFIIRNNQDLIKKIILLIFIGFFGLKLLTSPQILSFINNATSFHLSNSYEIPIIKLSINNLIHFGLFFIGGSVLASINIKEIRFKNIFFRSSIFLTILLLLLGKFSLFQYFLLPLIFIISGLKNTRGLAGLNEKIGDLSYGVYLYGFPIQQTLVYFLKCNHVLLMVLTIPLALLCGFLSWNFVEKRALKYKLGNYSFRTGVRLNNK